ncbi:hypothetical protein [Rippkaea orientalis]|uniref:hypothetical protein n=1 Tax=Rippkaea orientalis TaxID=2546366 RepID=UPI00031C0F7A|nr:hypothetical protein [Rippkaea orientalis]
MTQNIRQGFPQFIKKSKPWLSLLYGVAISLTITEISTAQRSGTLPPPSPLRVPDVAIPTAPDVPNSFSIPIKAVPTPAKTDSTIREYTFKAPTPPPSTPSSEIETIPATINDSSASSEIETTPATINDSSAPSGIQIPTAINNPSPSAIPQTAGKPSLYRVEVAGREASLLSQVKTVEPLAFIRQSEGVIHAGTFQQSDEAQKRVQVLQQKGVSATVVPVYEGHSNNTSVPRRPIIAN